jgi:cell division protein FtsI (penicillin-binding protein 3)/stage V sporulation protein D (sporulation-specific penicillin-binding protein)
MSPAFISRWRFAFVFLAIALGYCGIVGRLYCLQILHGDEIAQLAENSREKVDVLRARRGNITDSHGNLLAATQPVIELGVDPERMKPEDEAKLPELARILGMDVEVIRALCAPGVRTNQATGEVRKIRWREIADAISDTDYDRIRALGIKAVYGNRKFVRDYPSGMAAAHLIGYMNKEEDAVMGVESLLDYYLRGQDGWRETEIDARRQELVQFEKRVVEARDGLNVELTIDLVIQDMIEREAAKLAETYHPESIVIIVSDPQTGDLLGLANWPTFDPGRYWEFPLENQRNRAITDVYEPGSTFKIVPVAGAMEERMVVPSSLVDCKSPAADYMGRRVSLPRDHEPLGIVPLSTVVAQSSNRGAAQLGIQLGGERLLDYTYRFGFGQRTGVFGPAEVSGIVHPLNRWDGLTISRMPMGQAVCVTAVQMHYAMSSVASDGILMQPRLVRRVFDGNGETVFEFSPRQRGRVVSEATAQRLALMLEAVPSKIGTAPRAEIRGFQVAGKTGTSQKIENGQYSHSKHVATFTGFFPRAIHASPSRSSSTTVTAPTAACATVA